MEFIIRGKRTQLEKSTCLNGIDELICKDLAKGTPDIRRVIASLDKLGKYIVNEVLIYFLHVFKYSGRQVVKEFAGFPAKNSLDSSVLQ